MDSVLSIWGQWGYVGLVSDIEDKYVKGGATPSKSEVEAFYIQPPKMCDEGREQAVPASVRASEPAEQPKSAVTVWAEGVSTGRCSLVKVCNECNYGPFCKFDSTP